MKLAEILKDSKYKLTQFNSVEKTIEENEAAALEFINLEVEKLDIYPSSGSDPLDG